MGNGVLPEVLAGTRDSRKEEMRGERRRSLRSPATLPGHLSALVCCLSRCILGQGGQVVSSDTETNARGGGGGGWFMFM